MTIPEVLDNELKAIAYHKYMNGGRYVLQSHNFISKRVHYYHDMLRNFTCIKCNSTCYDIIYHDRFFNPLSCEEMQIKKLLE